jgi:hypothetical protein
MGDTRGCAAVATRFSSPWIPVRLRVRVTYDLLLERKVTIKLAKGRVGGWWGGTPQVSSGRGVDRCGSPASALASIDYRSDGGTGIW